MIALRNILVFALILVVVVGGGAWVLSVIDDDGDGDSGNLVSDVELREIREATFDETTNFIYLDVVYRPTDEDAPDIACQAADAAGNVAIGERYVWGNLDEPGVVRKSVGMNDVPDGAYTVTCTSGETDATATVEVTHDPAFVVSRVIAQSYEIQTFELSPDTPPRETDLIIEPVTFTFFGDGRVERRLQSQSEPAVFRPQEDGTYFMEEEIGPTVRQETTIEFLEDGGVRTALITQFVGAQTWKTETVWRPARQQGPIGPVSEDDAATGSAAGGEHDGDESAAPSPVPSSTPATGS